MVGDGDYERVDQREVESMLFAAWLEDADIERFLLRVASDNSLFEVSADLWSFRARLDRLVRSGEIVGGREVTSRTDDRDRKRVREERDVAREATAIQRGYSLIPGRRAVLISGADFGQLPGRDRYRVLGHHESSIVIASAIASAKPEVVDKVRAVFERAIALLAPDWRLPQAPQGLLLLVEIPVAVDGRLPESALTPSQMKRLVAGWIELVVVWDETGQPVPEVSLTIESSGNRQSATTDADGRIRVEDVDGSCEVTSGVESATINQCLTVTGVDPSAPAATRDRPASSSSKTSPLCIATIDAHKVKSGETIASIAADAGIDWQQLARFNWGTNVPREINERLRDEVGCTKKTVDGRNYVLDDIDEPGIIYVPSEWRRSFQPGRTHYIRVRRSKGILLLLENEQGLRLPEVGYSVAFDDGTERTGQLGRSGIAHVPAPSTGTFLVTYPDEVDILAKSLAACVRKGLDDHQTAQIFRLFTHDKPVVVRAVAAYDRYFNDYTGNGFVADVYQEFTDPDALAVCEDLMALHGLLTRAGVRVGVPSESEAADDGGPVLA